MPHPPSVDNNRFLLLFSHETKRSRPLSLATPTTSNKLFYLCSPLLSNTTLHKDLSAGAAFANVLRIESPVGQGFGLIAVDLVIHDDEGQDGRCCGGEDPESARHKCECDEIEATRLHLYRAHALWIPSGRIEPRNASEGANASPFHRTPSRDAPLPQPA